MICTKEGKWWLGHNWTEWQIERQPITRQGIRERQVIVGYFVTQERHCTRCNKTQNKMEKQEI